MTELCWPWTEFFPPRYLATNYMYYIVLPRGVTTVTSRQLVIIARFILLHSVGYCNNFAPYRNIVDQVIYQWSKLVPTCV